MAFNQSKYFVDNLSRNVKRGLINKARRGEFPMKAPWGYLNNRLTKKIIINKKTYKFIKKAFHLYSTGKYSYKDISQYLASRKIGRINKKTKKLESYSINGVYHMLTKPFYHGYFKYCGELYKGTHKPLISKKLFDQVQGVVLSRSKNRKRIHNFAFTNLIKCAECGYMITAEKHTKYYKETNRMANYTYYRCSKKSKINCSQPYISENDLLDQINKYIQKVSLKKEWKNKMLAKLNKDGEEANKSISIHKKEFEQILKNLQFKLDKLLDSFLEGLINRKTFLQKKEQLMNQKMEINDKIEGFKKKKIYWLEPFKKWILLASLGEKIAKNENLEDKLFFLKSCGSNCTLKDKKLEFIWQKPWARLTARPTVRTFVRLGRLELPTSPSEAECSIH